MSAAVLAYPRVAAEGLPFGRSFCAARAVCHSLPAYGLAWACLGLGMRLTLYDAAFAALACIVRLRA